MPRHRKHIKTPYLDYDTASKLVREEGITTRAQYLEWYDEHKPGYLPRWPHHVWKDFSWNDFLGTTNSFDKTVDKRKGNVRTYRPMWEAVRYAQAQAKEYKLSTREQWMNFYEEYEVPDDIPKRPWQVYEEFPGIDVWLGNDAVAHHRTAVEGNVAVVALHQINGLPANCVQLRVWKDGFAAMKTELNDSGTIVGRPLKVWHWDESGMKVALQRMNQHGHAKDGYFVVPNMNALLWDLMDCFDIYQ